MGYAMGQFFHLKYVVMYGMSSHLAKLDGVEARDTQPVLGGFISTAICGDTSTPACMSS